uniref:Tubby C-terminal domain-containing protein n=1 Tax=Tetraselmis chuii TaxID=63592 RepID=A0A7S1SM27_9CHLO|mmetsp:Transcript_18031/g.32109  ORF Transcript_18031/g.32109 Transcript_18031/m.32109 type:complete len:369 (+) Transcript_18031:231-1337(+)|eukprot:CAMPEP_0177760654 /NCGR_PEP_ID=MMETSP0491_2-20121128/5380_1 /TAXON_ID=63592 /ORGANISM="Tetraselmis chuii, Strain PLY429" /LENGTH=368 /DNA_ID=CAMNT_0019276563 /DNA_START=123 /DNA_END=1229 /DNA_ORIENTATION=-
MPRSGASLLGGLGRGGEEQQAVRAAELHKSGTGSRNGQSAQYHLQETPVGSGEWKISAPQAEEQPHGKSARTSGLHSSHAHHHHTQHHHKRNEQERHASCSKASTSTDAAVIDIPDFSALNIRPAERGLGLVKCDLERTQNPFAKGGLFGAESTGFRMFVAGTDELILSAKKKGNEFLISSYSDQHNQNHCAVLSWNSWRTEFFLRSRWCELCEPNATPFTCTTPPEEREMLAAILYERNYKGDCPKKFTVVIPKVSKQGQREVFCPRRKKNLVECFDSGDWGDIIPFTTKPPEWNEAKQRFEGGFTDRVKLASIRNFILQKAGKSESWLQCGKFGKHRYALDFQNPMSPIQAFATAISSFEASSMYT